MFTWEEYGTYGSYKHLSSSGCARRRGEEKGWRGCVTQLVISVEPTGEDGPSLTEKHSVVNPQCKGAAGGREGNRCRHQLHRLAAVAQSTTSPVATGQCCPRTGDKACVELSEAHRGEKSARLAEVVQNVRSVPHRVGAKSKVVVRVGSP